METTESIINTVFFYIISATSLVAALFCLFQKNTISAIFSALVAFWAVSGVYFLLNAPYLACVQIIIWGVSIGIIMLFSAMTTSEKNNKTASDFSPKIILTPVLCMLFAILIIPFLIDKFGEFNTPQTFSMIDFSETLYKNSTFAFEITGVLLFLALVGISAIIFSKINKTGKMRGIKK